MGCTSGKQAPVDNRPLEVTYMDLGLNQPYSNDFKNQFEKDLFMAINLLRFKPRAFIIHVQRVM